MSEQIGILRQIAATKRLLGDVARLQHQYGKALISYQEALTLVDSQVIVHKLAAPYCPWDSLNMQGTQAPPL